MLNYNDSNICVGFIKQLLATFNLPMIPVVKEDMYLKEGNFYIYGFKIIKMLTTVSKAPSTLSSQTYEDIAPYIWNKKAVGSSLAYNKKALNFTQTLAVNSNIYDTHTHTYLGNYLRFLRDFTGLNLMSMYNCFSNEIVNNIDINFTINSLTPIQYNRVVNQTLTMSSTYPGATITQNTDDSFSSLNINLDNDAYDNGVLDVPYEETPFIKQIQVSSSDTKYKIYKIPVKFNKSYTIALESPFPVEFVCGFYSKTLMTDTNLTTIYPKTYRSINAMRFSEPILFDALTKFPPTDAYIDKEEDLCLFIKVASSNKSSIVVLEGDYRQYNSVYFNDSDIGSLQKHNYSVNNYDNKESYEKESVPSVVTDKTKIKLISSLQLLSINSLISHPFADRLLEYLVDNAITHLDAVSDNIKRIQKYLCASNKNYAIDVYGQWGNDYNNRIYDSVVLNNDYLVFHQDVLGYVDKDIEHKMGDAIDIYDESMANTTISATKVKTTTNKEQ